MRGFQVEPVGCVSMRSMSRCAGLKTAGNCCIINDMRPSRLFIRSALATLLLVIALPVQATSPASARIDPRLAYALVPGTPPVSVWVEFVDKGASSPRDLIQRLAAAEAALTPEARRRREKAHVTPIVDELDLPIEPAYLRSLETKGYTYYGASRWFNRVAVQSSGEQLVQLGSLPFVRRVRPVERARPRMPELQLSESPDGLALPTVARGGSPSAVQASYGRTLGQIQRLNMVAVHDSGYTGVGVNVCLLDDGFNWYRKHETLRNIPVANGHTRDFIRGVASVQDTSSVFSSYYMHGTATLSALAGRMDGRYLAPAYGCNVILGRTEFDGTEKPIEMVYWAQGAEWADSLGADIISTSLGYNLFPDSLGTDITYPMLDGQTSIVTRAAQIAAAKGILVVVSAGNDGNTSAVGYKISAPADANGDSVIAIGAIDSLGFRASFSSKGPTFDGRIKPDLAAQGVRVHVASTSGVPTAYAQQSGTSFSCPLTAGVAACLMQARPTWSPVMIIQALKRTASRAASPDTLTGWGVPDGLAALQYQPDPLGVGHGAGPLSLAFTGPNPMRYGQAMRVRFALDAGIPSSPYRLRVLDAAGRQVCALGSGTVGGAGVVEHVWSAVDGAGRSVVPGLYFLALDAAGQQRTARIVVLR